MSAENLSFSVAEALLRTQRARRTEAGAEESSRRFPTVAVSREVAALGGTVARAVGHRLGYPVYGREIVEKIAEELRQPASQLHRLDERPTFWLEDWVHGWSGFRPTVNTDTYVRFLVATVRGMAEVGRCVFVGRGAFRILPPEHTLCVRLIADRSDRIQNAQRLRHLSEREAASWIDHVEQERTAFMRRAFGIDPADPHLYDLILNSSRLSVDECADTIVHAFRQLEARCARSSSGTP